MAKKWIKEGVKVIDVREPQEFLAGHIPRAKLIPRRVLYGAVKKGILKANKKYIIVCRMGYRALLVAAALMKWYKFEDKFEDVYVLRGGIKAWIKNGNIVMNALKLGPVKIKLIK